MPCGGAAAAIAAAYRRSSTLPGTGQVVVTEDASADAYTIPGWPCRIVITQGMLDALACAERDVLLAHERAHARNSHYLFTSAARLAAAANPLLRPVAAEVGYVVERWADERAAADTREGALTARRRPRRAGDRRFPARPHAAVTALGLIIQEGEGRGKRRASQAHEPQAARPRPGTAPRRRAARPVARTGTLDTAHAAARRGRAPYGHLRRRRPSRRPATSISSSSSPKPSPPNRPPIASLSVLITFPPRVLPRNR